MHIYPWQTDPNPPPPVKHRLLENYYYSKYVLHIEECTYTHGTLTPTLLLQSIIDLWKTTTMLNMFYIEKNAHTPIAD